LAVGIAEVGVSDIGVIGQVNIHGG
jgi:hypothetical protein